MTEIYTLYVVLASLPYETLATDSNLNPGKGWGRSYTGVMPLELIKVFHGG